MTRTACLTAIALLAFAFGHAHAQGPPDAAPLALVADRVFDGQNMQTGWVVVVRGQRIEGAGPAASTSPAGARTIKLAGMTLMPGLIEGHSHLLLYASPAPWGMRNER